MFKEYLNTDIVETLVIALGCSNCSLLVALRPQVDRNLPIRLKLDLFSANCQLLHNHKKGIQLFGIQLVTNMNKYYKVRTLAHLIFSHI